MSHATSPQSIEELQHLFRTSSEAGRPLYIYRQAKADGLTVDLQELNRIIEIDAANLVATVQPGVRLGTLARRLREQGMRFIPADTPFYHDKTLGQLFYEGCSNISSLKYGFTKHFLMGSEIVLPTGDLLKTGGKTVKNVTGYDFTRFFNAPYTDYGVTVTFLLKLLPLPESRRGLAAAFASLEKLLAFMRALRESRLVPAYLLWIDPGVQNLYQAGGQGQLVVMEFDGLAAETAEQAQKTTVLAETYGGALYDSHDRLVSQWAPLYGQGGNFVLTDEYKLAFTRQEEFINQFYAIAEKFALQAGLFGQLAEGKLNIALSRPEPECGFLDAVRQAVIQAGGIAAGKYDRLAGRFGRGALAVLEQRAKAAFDPQMILNR